MGRTKKKIDTPKKELSKEYKEILEYIFKNQKITLTELVDNFKDTYDNFKTKK